MVTLYPYVVPFHQSQYHRHSSRLPSRRTRMSICHPFALFNHWYCYILITYSHDRECKKIKSFQGSSEVSGPLIESVSDISQHSGIKYGLIVANRGIPWNHRTKTYRRSRLSFKTKNVLKISSFTQQHMVHEVNNNFLKYTFNSKNENRIR